MRVAVEKLMGVKPPERAEYIRVIMAELTRVMNHLAFCGFLTNEMGAFFTPFIYAFEERELILDLFEMASGSRMMCNYFRFGGVVRDVSDDFMDRLKHLGVRAAAAQDGRDGRADHDQRNRPQPLDRRGGVLTPQDAISLGAAGPLLRATGVKYDVRKAEPYSIYDRFDFDIVTGAHGDVYDRYLVRIGEIRQSLRILRQAHRANAGGRRDSDRQEAVPGARAGRPGVWPRGSAQRRVGLLRRERWQPEPVPLSRPRDELYQSGHRSRPWRSAPRSPMPSSRWAALTRPWVKWTAECGLQIAEQAGLEARTAIRNQNPKSEMEQLCHTDWELPKACG